MGDQRCREFGHPGLHHRYQRRPGGHGRLQDRHDLIVLSSRYLPDGVLRRGRSPFHHLGQPVERDESAGLPERRGYRPRRLWELERERVVVGAIRTRYRASTSPSWSGPTELPAPAMSSSLSATTTVSPISCSRPPTPPGRPTTSTGATASIPAHRPVAPSRSATTDRSPLATPTRRTGSSTPSTRCSLHRAQRVRRQLLHRDRQ